MNARELIVFLKDFKCLNKVSICISDINGLPATVVNHYPQLFIINPGKHWLCVFFYDSTKAEYFDSLGKCVEFYGTNLAKFISNNAKDCFSIQRQLQSNTSDICGLYVVCFVVMKVCYQFSIKNFNDMFTDNVFENDQFIKMFFSK